MFEAFCFFWGALFLMLAGQLIIAGIIKHDVKLKVNGMFNLFISGIWMSIGIFISY
jgi:hypothetical protein